MLLETMIAAFVMVAVIATSITTLQQGLRALDTARSTTIAAQVLQSVMEDLRLQTWSQIEALAAQSDNGTDGNVTIGTSFTGSNPIAANVLSRFTVSRTISDHPSRSGMKQIVLVATWRGIDGRVHRVNYTSCYGQNGLYDYYHS